MLLLRRLLIVAVLAVACCAHNVIASRVGDDIADFTNVQLWECVGGPRQEWEIKTGAYPSNNIALKAGGLVLDILQWSNTSGANIQVFLPTTSPWNQQFMYDQNRKTIVSLMNGYCADAEAFGNSSGTNIYAWPCTNNSNEQFIYNETSGLFRYVQNPALCLDAGTTANCSVSPYSGYPYCNTSLDIDDRVSDILSRMSLHDKSQLIQNNNPGVPSLGLPKLPFSECLHGVLSGCGSSSGPDSTGCPTSFPHALGLGATFNRSLWSHVSSTISTEARALNNQGVTGLAFWAPDINLFRDPRWGRGQEVPGEDPYLTAEYVAHYSRGLQEGDDSRYLKVVSTCKHFSAYDLEGWNGVDRHHFNAIVSERDLVEFYWVPFRSCVQRAHAQSIMCSYNAVNGVPSCANSLFQNTIVRDEWGFDGFIVSDCGAINDIISTHKYTSTPDDTCKAGLLGGCDLNCGGYYGGNMENAVNNGSVPQEALDVAVTRILKHMFWLGLMDPVEHQYYKTLGPEHVDTATHRQLALSAAEQMIVLLKNDGGMLPIDSGKTIALIGPHANATQDMLSNYHGTNTVVNSHSPLMSISALLGAGKVKYSKGCDISSTDTSHIADAVTTAKSSDVAIVFLGLNGGQESEGRDRTSIELPGVQEQLVEAVMGVNKNTVVVLINGGQVAIEWISTNAPAIVEALYPGEMGGDAIANILFGKVSPSGRLPYTMYPADFIKRSFFNMDLRNDSGCTYRYYTGQPLFTFGDGLSYTTFEYKWSSDIIGGYRGFDAGRVGRQDDTIQYTVEVTNTGKVDSDVSVLGFISAQDVPDAPLKELYDFGRVHLAAGASATVHLTVAPEGLSLVDTDGVEAVRPGRYKIQVENLTADLEITGEEHVLFSLPEMKRRHAEKQYRL